MTSPRACPPKSVKVGAGDGDCLFQLDRVLCRMNGLVTGRPMNRERMKKTIGNGNNLSVRRAELRDASPLAALGSRTFADTYSDILPGKDLDEYLRTAFSAEQMLEDIANPNILLFVGWISNTACSYVKLEPTPARKVIRGPEPIELSRLYVSTQWKGLGIGTVLLDVGLEAAREKAYRTCWLKVWEGNRQAMQFYMNRGFSPVGNEPYPVGSTSRNVVLMECSL